MEKLATAAAALAALVLPAHALAGTKEVDDDRSQCPDAQFERIQDAVDAAAPGDVIRVCAGTYREQVTVATSAKSNLTLVSTPARAAVIQAPATMTEPGDVVRITGGAQNVNLLVLTIRGPLPDALFCSLTTRTGVRVDGGSSATIAGNRITEIRSASPALRGCQNGIAILVGRAFEAQTGTARVVANDVDRYQKGGVVVDNAGSYALVQGNLFQGDGRTEVIAQNGIQISRGARADAVRNRVFDHTYALAPAWSSTGILLFAAAAGTVVRENEARRNDDNIALYTTSGAHVVENTATDSTFYDGIYAGADTSNNLVERNVLLRNAEHDCHDDSVGPNNPPALVANVWRRNRGETENREGLCDGQRDDDDDDDSDDDSDDD